MTLAGWGLYVAGAGQQAADERVSTVASGAASVAELAEVAQAGDMTPLIRDCVE